MWPLRPPMILGLGPVALAAILRSLAEQLRLLREDVIEHPVESPAFEAVVRDHACALEVARQRGPHPPCAARLSSYLGLLEQLQAPVEGELAKPVLADRHPAVLTCLELQPGPHRSLAL